MKIEIDEESGFCYGVQNTVNFAEEELGAAGSLLCLGEIVHNPVELARLKNLGLRVISIEEFTGLSNVKVLIRAHGEPPAIYSIAHKNNIELIDATCPVVSRLQARIRAGYQQSKRIGGTVVIYGKPDHPEVRALVGQTEGEARVIRDLSDMAGINFKKPVFLYSQTTMSKKGYDEIISWIKGKILSIGGDPDKIFHVNQSICRHVSHRQARLKEFADSFGTILFVSSKESSNGKILFKTCRSVNPASFFITDIRDVDKVPLSKKTSIGICGATSTPRWLLEKVKKRVEEII